jgi:hypothetical protein
MLDLLTSARTRLEPLLYQAAVYFTLSVLDDPAMLAMIFW